MSHLDTIVALATPQGYGGIGIIRISGTLVPEISYKLLKKIPYPRQATHLPLYDYNNKNILDNVIAIFFPQPHSFTAENILEIHGHGSPIILETIIQNILQIQISKQHIRLALPGEFSERAFINNKIDLIQAEAISDLIHANSYQAAKIALQTLQGSFSKKIYKLEKQISNLRIYIESNIDFPEEKIITLDYNKIKKQIKYITNETMKICEHAKKGIIIQKGIKIVITGQPNVGKSSLFNILSKKESAIVTPISGTTRDVLHEFIQFEGMLINIVDTAGLKEDITINNSKQIDEIETIGIKRAWTEIKNADHILLLTDANTTSSLECYKLQLKIKKHLNNNKTSITIIRNKADLTHEKINIRHTKTQETIITISAKYNQGIHLIQQHLKNKMTKLLKKQQGYFSARQRHLESLNAIHQHLLQINERINNHLSYNNELEIEIIAEELRCAHTEINKITGRYNSKELIKKIFSTFCIGK